LPSPFLTVIFTLDEPLRIARHADPGQPAGQYVTLVGGLHTSPVVLVHDGAQSGIQLQVSPLGARGLFGMPAGELASVDVSGDVVLGAVAGQLQERIAAAKSWPKRFALVDRARVPARRGVPACGAGPAGMGGAVPSGGQVAIASVADDVAWSTRHLVRQFQIEIGLTPKTAARVIRFDRARRLIPHHRGAEVAARCGYTDQSHLVRDFLDLTGLPPTR